MILGSKLRKKKRKRVCPLVRGEVGDEGINLPVL